MKIPIAQLKRAGFLLIVLQLFFYPCAQGETVKNFYEQGQQAYNQGDYKTAIELYEKAVDLDPNFAPAYNALGLAHREINTDLSEMAWLFKTATEIDPNYAQAYDNLGKAYYGLGDFDRAEQSCLKALAISPNLPSAELSLGWIYLLGKSQPQEAVTYFKEVLKNNKIPYAYFGLGMAYFMSGDRINVLEMITILRSMEREDLALQLENMVRQGNYAGQEKGTPLVNTQPRNIESTLISRSPAVGRPAASKDEKASMMRVRLKGKMFSVPSQESAAKPPTPTTPSTKPLGVLEDSSSSTSSIERIKNLRARTISTGGHPPTQPTSPTNY